MLFLSVFTVLVAACAGGDTPEALQSALASSATDLPYVEQENAPCVGEAVLEDIGMETMQTEQITVARLDTGAISTAELLELHASDSLHVEVAECLDQTRLYRESLEASIAPAGLTCENTFEGRSGDVVLGLIAETPIVPEFDDTTENRDLLRTCLTDADFANLFGLDQRSDLVEALAFTLASDNSEDQEVASTCVADSIVAAVGVEQLNAMGVTAEADGFSLATLDLDDAAEDDLINEARECLGNFEAEASATAVGEVFFADCLLAGLVEDQGWVTLQVRGALGDQARERSLERRVDAVLDDCVEQRVIELWGADALDVRGAAGLFSSTTMSALRTGADSDKFVASEAELKCASYGLHNLKTEQELEEAYIGFGEHSEEEFEYWIARDTVWGTFDRALRSCIGDWLYTSGDLERGGFSDNTLDCFRERFGSVSELADVMTVNTTELTDAEFWDYSDDFDRLLFEFEQALERCYADDEQDIFDDWVSWLEGADVFYEEDGEIST